MNAVVLFVICRAIIIRPSVMQSTSWTSSKHCRMKTAFLSSAR